VENPRATSTVAVVLLLQPYVSSVCFTARDLQALQLSHLGITEGRIPVGFSFQFATEHGLLSCELPCNCWLCVRVACLTFSHRTTPARHADIVTPTSLRHFLEMRALCGLAVLALCGVVDAGQTPCLATGKGPVSCEVCADVSFRRAPALTRGCGGGFL